MNLISFDKILLQTAFCCMASDGDIDKREIALIKSMCENSSMFVDFNFEVELNKLVSELNKQGKVFITNYFELLKNSNLTEKEELEIIDFAIKTIYADDVVEYSEIKFFKVIRHNLKIADEKILVQFPTIEQFLEKDIVAESYLEKITKQYLDMTNLPQFELIASIDADLPACATIGSSAS